MRKQIKICGITRQADLQACVDLGVGFVGFNFYPRSKRYLTADQALSMRREVGEVGDLESVGLFVQASLSEIRTCLQKCPFIKIVQLHGGESLDFAAELCRALPEITQVWMAKHVQSAQDVEVLQPPGNWPRDIQLLPLFDTGGQTEPGGTGVRFEWQWLKNFPEPFAVAGGIHSGNIRELAKIRPRVVDICSGVESAPGRKERAKIKEVCEIWDS